MPTPSNMDVALHTLAQEINALDKQGRGVVVVTGRKLIAVRALLREQNGLQSHGVKAPDGPSPKGWIKWIENNLTITSSHARKCILYALAPEEGIKAKARERRYSRLSPRPAITSIKRSWPNLTTEQRSTIRQTVIALSKEAY